MSKTRYTGPIIAITIVAALAAWMYSGTNSESSKNTGQQTAPNRDITAKVQVITSVAQPVEQVLTVNGITEAKRQVQVASEASGRVTEILVEEGQTVEANAVIAKLDIGDLPARLRQARAQQEQARLEHEGMTRLVRQGLQTESSQAATLAAYEQSRAQLASLELALANTSVRAPFAGVVESLPIEIGSYIRPGDSVAEIVDYSSLIFSGSVAEKDIVNVSVGQSATVSILNGPEASATVSRIRSVSSPTTRTFRIELEINDDQRTLSGVTSVAQIKLGNTSGHFISPALLYINENGTMGLKTIDTNNSVAFNEVNIIRSSTDGVWVSGLANEATVIVVGQGFVNVGDPVDPTERAFDRNIAVGL